MFVQWPVRPDMSIRMLSYSAENVMDMVIVMFAVNVYVIDIMEAMMITVPFVLLKKII